MSIPEKVINRLTMYHFILEDVHEKYISSTKFANLLDIDNSQVRKDLKYIDNQGKCRVGYEVKTLKHKIEECLGFKKTRDVFIVGAGNLGSALAKYDSFKDYGLNVIAMFDKDPKKIGMVINGKEVFDISRVGNLAQRLGVETAILTVPREHAQGAANYLAGVGIKYIWNFTTCVLDVPNCVRVWNENLIGSFLQFTNRDEVTENSNDN